MIWPWWGLCSLRHGIQISMGIPQIIIKKINKKMEAILACHPARSTEWLDCHPKSCELWRIRTGPIVVNTLAKKKYYKHGFAYQRFVLDLACWSSAVQLAISVFPVYCTIWRAAEEWLGYSRQKRGHWQQHNTGNFEGPWLGFHLVSCSQLTSLRQKILEKPETRFTCCMVF